MPQHGSGEFGKRCFAIEPRLGFVAPCCKRRRRFATGALDQADRGGKVIGLGIGAGTLGDIAPIRLADNADGDERSKQVDQIVPVILFGFGLGFAAGAGNVAMSVPNSPASACASGSPVAA